ncbi:MAG TPA: right-handed parallel beta-helix repeat-containing protein, partial [Pirellulaceae bacterium]
MGGSEGLRVDGTSHDTTLSNSTVRNNVVGIHVLSTANRAIISQNDIYANTGTFTSLEALVLEGDDLRVEGNVIHNNATSGISVTFAAQNAILRGNDVYNNPWYGIHVNGPNALIEQNIVRGSGVDPNNGALVVFNVAAVVQDNVVYGNNRAGIDTNSTAIVVQRNVVYNNTDGIKGTGIFRDNRIFHNSQAGVKITGLNPLVSGNSIYANATGIVTAPGAGQSATLANNVIYDHSAIGIDIGIGLTGLNILNNTIFEPTGTSIRLNAAGTANVRDNILSTVSGTLFNVATVGQAGFTSDYNLLHVTGTGRVGAWGTDTIIGRSDWFFELGRDEHSLEADPLLVDVDGPDGRRGWDVATSTDFGVDDDFREQVGSPAIDAGDPLSYYVLEPISGNRVNAGAFGNTVQAAASLPQGIQLTEPAGLRK